MKMIIETYWKPSYNPFAMKMECQDYPLKNSTSYPNGGGYKTIEEGIKELKTRFKHRYIGRTIDKKGILFNEDYTIQIVRFEN